MRRFCVFGRKPPPCLAAEIIDPVVVLYPRGVVGGGMGSFMTIDIVITAPLDHLLRRRPKNRVIIQSDQDSEFSSHMWIRLCRDHNRGLRMSQRGD